jgi:hypothetical protein
MSAPVNPTGLPTTEGGTGHTLKQQKEFLQPDKPESESRRHRSRRLL